MNKFIEKTRFYSLDFLKFILAIVIVFHHFQQVTGTKFNGINFYGGRIYFGYVVECFFIISGFVTALGLEKKKLVSLKKWMCEKALRIYPMTILSVFVTFGVYVLHRLILGSFPTGVLTGLWQFLNSLTLTFVGGGGR